MTTNEMSTSKQKTGEAAASETFAARIGHGDASSRWKLVDLIDVTMLQRLQDAFANLCRAAVSIRDADGNLITKPSRSNWFCTLVAGSERVEEKCRLSNAESAARAHRTGRPAKYVCHAGLTQYAASIMLDGQVLGTIVLGDRPKDALDRQSVKRLADELGKNVDGLWEAAQQIEPWSDEEMQSAIVFLQQLANTLTQICYQTAILRERLKELRVIEETARMIASDLDLETVLTNIARTIVDVMNVKACSLRLVDESGKELVTKASHNLSHGYLKKGPVLLHENVYDRLMLSGEVVRIIDMATDPHVRYADAARDEGLRSSLGIGMIASGRPIGTLHIYTGVQHEFSDEEVRVFRSVAHQAATAIEKSRLLQEQVSKLQIEHELKLASEVQRRMLPHSAPHVQGLDIHAVSVFSSQVGGDFYDYIVMPKGRIGITIADTVGKSVPAAIMTASVRSALKAQAQNIFRISDVVARVNTMLCEDTLPSEFVTLFYGVIDAGTKRLAYCNAGHEPSLLLRHDGRLEKLTAGGPLLGVLPEAPFRQETISLEPGDTLLLYTDGAIDAMNYKKERYGRQRLEESLRHWSGKAETATELVSQIHWDIRRFAGLNARTDDLTLLAVRVTGNFAAPATAATPTD